MNADDRISDCGRYRYTLSREWDAEMETLTWLMLNPSTADAAKDDPTIRKVMGFTKRAGYGSLLVVNLFAWRATDPSDLRTEIRRPSGDPEGPENQEAITVAARITDAVVCAWGAQPWARYQAKRVLGWLRERDTKMRCLGLTKGGDPLHPLMQSYDGHPLVPFESDTDRLGTDSETKSGKGT